MDWLTFSGTCSLGIVIGWMVRRTFNQQQKLDAKVLGTIVSVMVGAGVIGLFKGFSGGHSMPREVYGYLIGLLCGIVFTAIGDFIAMAGGETEEDIRERRIELKNALVHHLANQSLRAVSFQNIRDDLGAAYSPNELRLLIRKFPTELQFERQPAGYDGVRLPRS